MTDDADADADDALSSLMQDTDSNGFGNTDVDGTGDYGCERIVGSDCGDCLDSLGRSLQNSEIGRRDRNDIVHSKILCRGPTALGKLV